MRDKLFFSGILLVFIIIALGVPRELSLGNYFYLFVVIALLAGVIWQGKKAFGKQSDKKQ